MLVAAVQFDVDLRRVRHKLSGVLHVGVREEGKIRRFRVRAVLVFLRCQVVEFRRRA